MGENVMNIEKEYDHATRDLLPIELDGRVLQDDEIIDDIKVADTDVLLYEVKSVSFLK